MTVFHVKLADHWLATWEEQLPFNRQGMTTARWRAIPPRLVAIASLTPTQRHLRGDGSTSYCGDVYPHVVECDRRLFVTDGHNRVAGLLEAGLSVALVRVYTIPR